MCIYGITPGRLLVGLPGLGDSTGTLCVTTAEPDTELRDPRRSASLQTGLAGLKAAAHLVAAAATAAALPRQPPGGQSAQCVKG